MVVLPCTEVDSWYIENRYPCSLFELAGGQSTVNDTLLFEKIANMMKRFDREAVLAASATGSNLPGFGARLKRLRKATGIKQTYLAVVVGVDQATISRWESGSIIPSAEHAAKVLGALSPEQHEDSALRRLVESSSLVVHLVTDVDHILLAASKGRESEWSRSAASLRGQCIWGAASPAIQDAELSLESRGWWESSHPDPVEIDLDAYDNGFLPIIPGRMLWERVWLSDGRPARLCTLSDGIRQTV